MLSAGATDDAALDTFYGGYLSVESIYQRVNEIAAAFPGFVERVDYGDSYSKTVGGVTTPGGQQLAGHDLLALKVTNQAVAGPKPAFFLMAGIHAREIATPEIALRFVDWLMQNYGADGDATWLVDQHEIWVVPTANPDGHWYVELGTRAPYNGDPWMWRKNGHLDGAGAWPPTAFSHGGVDLNRNFAFGWGTRGVDWSHGSQTYPGTSAASEPETRALQDLLTAVFPDQRGPGDSDPAPETTTGMLVSLHQHGELVLWPWWDTESPAPNSAGLETIGRKLASYNGYTAGPGATTLYDASGTTDDWGYGVLGVPSYTFEVGREFLPAYTTVDGTLWPENSAALLYAAKIARTPYLTAYGPDAGAVAVTGAGSRFAITASIDDAANGGETIAAAEFYVDIPPWRSGAVAHALAAADGNFDSSVERVTASLTVEGAGSHVVYVRGQDATGHWGPFSAELLTSVPPARWWYNAANPFDVNGLDGVQPLDVLIIINAINAQGARPLQAPAPGSGSPPPFLDVSGDDWLTPEDALRVIDYLNSGAFVGVAAEGEPGGALPAYPTDIRATDEAIPSELPVDARRAIGPEPAIRAKKPLPPVRCAPADRTNVVRGPAGRAYR